MMESNPFLQNLKQTVLWMNVFSHIADKLIDFLRQLADRFQNCKLFGCLLGLPSSVCVDEATISVGGHGHGDLRSSLDTADTAEIEAEIAFAE